MGLGREGDAEQRNRERFLRSIARQAGTELESLAEQGEGCGALEYFHGVLESAFVVNDPLTLFGPDVARKPIVGLYCIMAPEELVYAAGAIPIRLCSGCFDAAKLSEDYLPRDCCPLVKSSMGLSARRGLKIFDLCDVVIVPTTCDSKRKLGEELSSRTTVWMLEVPHVKESEYAKRIWIEQMWALKNRLETLVTDDGRGCRKITASLLGRSIDDSLRAQREIRRLLDLRKKDEPPISGRQAAAVINSYAYAPVGEWTAALARLNIELSAGGGPRGKGGSGRPRIYLAGSPVVFPNMKVPELVEEMGGVVVADESCAGDRYLYDPVGATERTLTDQITALASRYMAPCVCPSFAPNQDRLFVMKRNLRDYAVDGVLYHVLKGCVVYDFEVARVERMLKELGIPMIRVETDYHPEDVEQLRTRVEAFVEMLKSRRRNAN